jgi:DNA-binding response OmpR family regulator
VLLVMPEQWPRALLRAALREVGYDAVGTRDLMDALRVQPDASERGPVRAIVVDQAALPSRGISPFTRLLEQHGNPPAILLARPTRAHPEGPWSRVLQRPVSVADIVAAVQELVPLEPAARQPVDRDPSMGAT